MDGYLDSKISDDKLEFDPQIGVLSHLDLREHTFAYDERQHNRRDSHSSFTSEPNVADLNICGSVGDDVEQSTSCRGSVVSKSALGSRRKIRKNNREKKRRLELNDKFEVLTDMLNMSCAKAEKFIILSEAISLIQSLRMENNSMQHEKMQLRSELQHMTALLQQAFPGSVLPEYQSSFLIGSEPQGQKETVDSFGFQAMPPTSRFQYDSFDNDASGLSNGSVQPQDLPLFRPGTDNPFHGNANSKSSESHFDIFV